MIRIRSNHTGLPGSPYLSTFYFAGDDATDVDLVCDAVEDFWAALASTIPTPNQMRVEQEVAVVDSATGLITDVIDAGPRTTIPGAAGTGGGPVTLQGLLRLRTAAFPAGRRVQGRLFLPAFATGGRVPLASYITTVNNAGAALAATAASSARPWVVYSPSNALSAAVVTVSTWDQWAVLRSRRT